MRIFFRSTSARVDTRFQPLRIESDGESMYFTGVEATLTDLQRKTANVLRNVRRGHKVTLTEHGQPVAEIVPVAKKDRAAALKALRAIGPIPFKPRK
jgi:prevent-host-death family protein